MKWQLCDVEIWRRLSEVVVSSRINAMWCTDQDGTGYRNGDWPGTCSAVQ